jgi:hypothetical protein
MTQASADVEFFVIGEELHEAELLPTTVGEPSVGSSADAESGEGESHAPAAWEADDDVLWADEGLFAGVGEEPTSSYRRGWWRGERRRDANAPTAPPVDSHGDAQPVISRAGGRPSHHVRRLTVGVAVALPLVVGVAVVFSHLGSEPAARDDTRTASGIVYEPEQPKEVEPRPRVGRRPDRAQAEPTRERVDRRQADSPRERGAARRPDRQGADVASEQDAAAQPAVEAPTAPVAPATTPTVPTPTPDPAMSEAAESAPVPADESTSSDFSFGAG